MSVSVSKIEVFLAIALIFGLSGCGKTEGVYVGHYYDGNETITLNVDGTYRQVFYFKGRLLYDKTNLWEKSGAEITFHQFHTIESWYKFQNGMQSKFPFPLGLTFQQSSITNKSGDYIGRPLDKWPAEIHTYGSSGVITFGNIEDSVQLVK